MLPLQQELKICHTYTPLNTLWWTVWKDGECSLPVLNIRLSDSTMESLRGPTNDVFPKYVGVL